MKTSETDRSSPPEQRDLFALLRSLVDSGVDLAHNTARMAASEGRVILHRALVRLGLFVAGLFVAGMGLLLALVGTALVLARFADIEPWAAFVVVGLATLAAGGAFAYRAMHRLGEADMAFPATLAEFDADIAMLRAGKSGAGDDPL